MLRYVVRPMCVAILGVALAVPAGVEAQQRTRSAPARVQAPPVPAATRGNAARSGEARGNSARNRPSTGPAARGPAAARGGGPADTPPATRGAGVRTDVRAVEPAAARRGSDRRDDDRRYDGVRYEDRRDDRRFESVRYDDDRRDGRYDDDHWARDANERRRWQMRSQADLQLFGFIGVDVRWDRYDTRDRLRWVERYRSYDGWGRFAWVVDGWFAPRWGDLSFDRDPLRYGPGRLDHRDLRRILGGRTFSRLVRGTPGGAGHLWGRVERFGPWGRSLTLEVWSGGRFVAAFTDFDRDLWIDDVQVNGRFLR